jgi:uncharacterized protein DUF2188
MPEGDVETFHKDGKWHNRIEGHGTMGGEYVNRADAVLIGREEARERKVEHVVHNLDGAIGERNSYGNDPRDIQG